MENKKTYGGSIAFIGSPNVGKSTLLNHILGKKISIVSDKPQTTRNEILGIYTKEDKQILFLDTPGLGKTIGQLSPHMNRIAEDSKYNADIILYMLDFTKGIRENDKAILESLRNVNLPIIAVFNKMDSIKQDDAILIMEELKSEECIKELFPISAINGTNVDSLLKELLSMIPENPHIYEKDELTNQSDEFVISEFIREQVFINSEKEIPYSILIQVDDFFEEDENTLGAYATILVPQERHRRILIGKGASLVKKIRLFSKKRLKTYFNKKFNLELVVKVKKDLKRDDSF